MPIPNDCSWSWHKILKLRAFAINISKYKIGNGQQASLWYSNWHPQGPLIPRYGDHIAYDAGIAKNAKISTVINNCNWRWPSPNSWELQDICSSQPDYSPQLLQANKFIWLPSKSGVYNAASTWNHIRNPYDRVQWCKIVWFTRNIPRHSFIRWLAVKNQMNTKEKLVKWGILAEAPCNLCNDEEENLSHLFFQCKFSKALRKEICKLCLTSKPHHSRNDEVRWMIGKFSGKNFLNYISKLAWNALVYHIWKERNHRAFKGISSSKDRILHVIKEEVRWKTSQSFNTNCIDTNMQLYTSWDCN